MSREDLRALMGPSSVIKTVQQQSDARAVVRALKHDPNGIVRVQRVTRAAELKKSEPEGLVRHYFFRFF